jgi:hypothetical protein
MAPAVPETPVGVKVMRLGVLKLARLRMLNNSARNCRLRRSCSVVFLMAEKSHVARPIFGVQSMTGVNRWGDPF